MVSRIADEGDYKYGKLNTIGWLKNGVEEVASRRALLMVCGHDEELKTKYACLNVLSTAEMYNIYFGWEFRDKGGNGRSVLLSLNSYTDSQLDRTMVFPPFRPSSLNSAFVAFAAREPSPIEFPHVDPTPQHLV